MIKKWLVRIFPVVFTVLSLHSAFAKNTTFDGSAIEPLSQEVKESRDSLRSERRKRFDFKTESRYRHALGAAIGGGNAYGPTYKLTLPRGFSAQLTMLGWSFSRSYDVDTIPPPPGDDKYIRYTSMPEYSKIEQTTFMSSLLVEKLLRRLRYGEFCAFGSIGGYYNREHKEMYRLTSEPDTTIPSGPLGYDVYSYEYEFDEFTHRHKSLDINLGMGASVFLLKMIFEAKGTVGFSWSIDKKDYSIGFGLRLAALYRFGNISRKQGE